jgi:GT2 family glycosyltransferase
LRVPGVEYQSGAERAHSKLRISGYVPCFNNEGTIVSAAMSLREQTIPVEEIFVVDDGSTDESAARAEAAGLRVLRQEKNLGRGAARARAMMEAKGELVLACDATARVAVNFLEIALKHFEKPRVATVFGRVIDKSPRGATGRWRARHLLRCHLRQEAKKAPKLATWGVAMRRDAALEVGNFDARLRHTEDAELGGRLQGAGWEVWYEPAAEVYPQTGNTLGQLLERHWRWNAGLEENYSLRSYLVQNWFAARTMALDDLKAGDPGSAIVSLLTPHYALWRWLKRKRNH